MCLFLFPPRVMRRKAVLLSFLFKVSEGGEWEVANNLQGFWCRCLEENVTKWVCGRGFWGRDWSCFHIEQGKHTIWISSAISFAIYRTQKLSHAFIAFLVLTQDCCNRWGWFHRGKFLLAGTSFLFVMSCKSPVILKKTNYQNQKPNLLYWTTSVLLHWRNSMFFALSAHV